MKFKVMPMFGVVFTTTATLLILLSSSVSGLTLEEKIRDDSDLSQVSKKLKSFCLYIIMSAIQVMNIKRIIFRCLCVGCVDVKLFVNYIFFIANETDNILCIMIHVVRSVLGQSTRDIKYKI